MIEWFLAVLAVMLVWSWLARQRVSADLRESHDDDTVIACRVEWHDSQCYVYRVDSDEFLGQGQDLDQAVAQMALRGLKGNWAIEQEMATESRQIQP